MSSRRTPNKNKASLLLMSCLSLLGVSAVHAETDQEAKKAQLESLFSEGMDALQDDRLKSAIEAFNSILSTEPTLHRARLELAVAYYRSLRYAEARRLAQEVLDDPTTPPQVRVSVLAFLAQIDKEEQSFSMPHEFKPSVGVGYMYDSNVTVGPSSDLLEINGIPYTLTAGQAQSDNAVVLTAGLAHRYKPGKTFSSGERTGSFEWLSQLNLYNRSYNDLDDYDQTILSASTGPAWVVLRHWRAALNLRLDKIWLGDNELALFSSLNPVVTYQFDNGEFTLHGSFTDRKYDDSANSGRDGAYMTIGGSIGIYLNQRKVATQAGVNLFSFDADTSRFSNDGWEAYLGAIVKAWPHGTVYARGGIKNVDYDGVEPLYNVARLEHDNSLRLGFSHDFTTGYLEKWALGGSFILNNNSSNVSIYDYDRHQVGVNLSRTF